MLLFPLGTQTSEKSEWPQRPRITLRALAGPVIVVHSLGADRNEVTNVGYPQLPQNSLKTEHL